jgi:hypothetical protein
MGLLSLERSCALEAQIGTVDRDAHAEHARERDVGYRDCIDACAGSNDQLGMI